MYYVTTERENLVRFLPKGGVAAEIGVAQGNFAATLLANAAPTKLHLIDPWAPSERDGDERKRAEFLSTIAAGSDPAPPPNPAGDRELQAVRERFKGDARVEFHRQYSYRAAATFPDKHFDFVYLDGDHTYEYVLRDLFDFAAKVKDGGLILGHDYFEDEFAAKENYGVIGAVNTFLARSGFIFVALTWELFPTYVLARRFEGFAMEFVRNLLESDVFAIDLPATLAFGYRELNYPRRSGPARRIPSFVRV
jgi:hypothetical protein